LAICSHSRWSAGHDAARLLDREAEERAPVAAEDVRHARPLQQPAVHLKKAHKPGTERR
jgi:hypothetical protein